jgi:transcriptional regulator with XRE-family HTH domain
MKIFSRYNKEAAILLGKQIKLARKLRKWTEDELAVRAGISRSTVKKIEKGDLGCAVGHVFEAAILVGIKLFEDENKDNPELIDETNRMLTLLPKRIRASNAKVDDDF